MNSYLEFLKTEYRWLTFGLLLTFVSGLGQTFFISLFALQIREDLILSHTNFASYYSIGTIAGGLVLFWAGKLIDQIRLHVFTGFVLLGLALAGFLLASAESAPYLILAFFLLRLCGQGLATHIAMTSMARWYARNRGKAISIASLGMPIGEAFLPPLVVVLLAMMSWRESWWLLTAIVATVFIPAALSLVWRGERSPQSVLEQQSGPDIRSWSRSEVVRTASFWMMMPAVLGPSWIFTGIFFHQVAIIGEKGWDFKIFALAYTAYAFMKVTISLLTGILIDRTSAHRWAPWTMPIKCASLLILVMVDDPMGAWFFMIVTGTHVGVHMTTMAALWPELYGRQHLGSIKALILSLGVLASAFGPPLFGIVLDAGLGASTLIWASAAFCIIAGIMMRQALIIHHKSNGIELKLNQKAT